MKELLLPFLSPVFIWLALMIIFIVIEMITVGLTSIWFAGGALVALFAAFIGMPVFGQVALFFVVSFILVFFTRPFALKFVKPHNIKTNYENVIGKEVRVTGTIDNLAETGAAVFNGQEWTARSADHGVVLQKGETVRVAEIRGVTLYVNRQEDKVVRNNKEV